MTTVDNQRSGEGGAGEGRHEGSKSAGRRLNGEAGLIISVIELAAKDAAGKNKDRRQDALDYFASHWYLEHLDWLGLDPSLRPVVTNRPRPL
jgi:hypothetical protein